MPEISALQRRSSAQCCTLRQGWFLKAAAQHALFHRVYSANEGLEGVVCGSLGWAELILRYDTPDRLFNLDLHYWGDENDYGKRVFERTDIQRMADLLRDLQWQFILLINDVP